MHVHPGHPEYEDYYQEGVLGLILAAIRFDESKGFQFSTFAFPNVSGRIQKYRRDIEPRIHYPRAIKDVLFQVIRYTNQGYTFSEIEEITGISGKDIRDAINVHNVGSTDQTIELKDGSITVGDTIASLSDDYMEVLDEEHIFDTIQIVTKTISNEVHQGIWTEWIYSLFYGEKLSQQYFAEKYHMSQVQISRLLGKFKKEFVKQLTK